MSGYFYFLAGENQCNIELDSCAMFPSLNTSMQPALPIYLGGTGQLEQGAVAGSSSSSGGSGLIWIIVIVIVILALAGTGAYFYIRHRKNKQLS